jgi:hypothetical protein
VDEYEEFLLRKVLKASLTNELPSVQEYAILGEID